MAAVTAALTALTVLAACSSDTRGDAQPTGSKRSSATTTSAELSPTSAVITPTADDDPPADAEPADDPQPAPETPEPDPEPDVIYLNDDSVIPGAFMNSRTRLSWRGGMIADWSGEPSYDMTIWGWTPGMDKVKQCTVQLMEDNEFAPSDVVVGSDISVMATTGSDPVVGVIYAATTVASGLTPEETRLYVQTLDLDTCSLGERIDVLDGPVSDQALPQAPAFISATEDVLVADPYAFTSNGYDDLPVLFGIDVRAGHTVWQRAFPGLGMNTSYTDASSSPGAAAGIVGVSMTTRGGDQDDYDAFLDAATGETVYSFDYNTLRAPMVRFYDGALSYRGCCGSDDQQYVITDGIATATAGGAIDPGLMGSKVGYAVGDDGDGNRIIVGWLSGSPDDERPLGYVGQDGTAKILIAGSQSSDLDLKLMGVTNGEVYVETTAEYLRMDLNGQQIGDPIDTMEFPYAPVAEYRVDGTLWTFWMHPLHGISMDSVGEDGYVVTKDGAIPRSERYETDDADG